MNDIVFCPFGHTDALTYAAESLAQKGFAVKPQPDHSVTHLLLPAPSFEADGSVKGGGRLQDAFEKLPDCVKVVGGNLQHPDLQNRKTVDLLQDPVYLAENANITAHCAVKLAMANLPVTLPGCHVLVIGWGRIGKCLAALLRQMGAVVTVAARKESDRAMLLALGYDALDCAGMDYSLVRYRVIYNTAPEMVLPKSSMEFCRPDCIKIDLASKLGMEGDDVIWARGLPNKDAPETSGELIARTILRLCTIHH